MQIGWYSRNETWREMKFGHFFWLKYELIVYSDEIHL